MKTTLRLSAVILAIFAMVFDGCKKGENDPTVSLRSRKARISGEWKLTAGTLTENNAGDIEVTTYTGTTYSVDGSTPVPYTEALTIEKDGTFKQTVTYGTIVGSVEGTWNFTGGVGETKKGEQVIFTPTSTTAGGSVTTYTGAEANDNSFIFQLDELRNNKMVVILDGTSAAGGSTTTTTGTMTYEQ